MHEVNADSFKTFVRGNLFTITPDFLVELLDIPRVEGALYPIVDNHPVSYNAVARVLTEKPIDWKQRSINQNRLTDSYRLLHIFLKHNLCPKGHEAGVTRENGYLLYCIGTNKLVDVPLTVFRCMARMMAASSNAILPFTALISKLLFNTCLEAEHN